MTTVSILTMALGCAAPLEAVDNGETEESEFPNVEPLEVEKEERGNPDSYPVYSLSVDATDETTWHYLDLETQEFVQPLDPLASDEWDLGFQRFKIASNGGISGTGGVVVAVLTNEEFDEIIEAPFAVYLEDQVDGDDENEDPDLVFLLGDAWYIYDSSDHTLSSRNNIYLVRTAEDNYFKIQVLGYYDDAGTSGYPQIRFAQIQPPATE